MKKFKKWYLDKKFVIGAGMVSAASVFAEGEKTQIETLWDKLNINFSTMMGDALEVLATPLVVVIGVGFVLAIVWACVSYGKGVFRPGARR